MGKRSHHRFQYLSLLKIWSHLSKDLLCAGELRGTKGREGRGGGGGGEVGRGVEEWRPVGEQATGVVDHVLTRAAGTRVWTVVRLPGRSR